MSLDLVDEKLFGVKDTGLNYRKISHWKKRGLLSFITDDIDPNQWSKFTLSELVEILMYKELSELGFDLKKLLKIQHRLRNKATLTDINGTILTKLFVNMALVEKLGYDIYAVVSKDASDFQLLRELDVMNLLKSDDSNAAYAVISLSKLLDRIKTDRAVKNKKMDALFKELAQFESAEIKVRKDERGDIVDIEKTEYRNVADLTESFNKVVNRPNQSTTIHSNKDGAQKLKITRKI